MAKRKAAPQGNPFAALVAATPIARQCGVCARPEVRGALHAALQAVADAKRRDIPLQKIRGWIEQETGFRMGDQLARRHLRHDPDSHALWEAVRHN